MTYIGHKPPAPPSSAPSLQIFQEMESSVRTYCRKFPVSFVRALNGVLWDGAGKRYIDFLSCAGALNYGHNNPVLKSALINYLQNDGLTTSLDMHTQAKGDFLDAFSRLILKPRQLDYKVQFTGPTGTNAIEAALKVARKATGRSTVVAFTNGFHGMTLGSLALTGNCADRKAGGTSLPNTVRMPYCGYFGADVDTVPYLEKMITDPAGGIDKPCALVLETVQGEGGLNIANAQWLQDIAAFAKRESILLIIDEVQTGCGRTGPFFSFERAGIQPDLVCLSKSIGGFGLPMAMVLIRPDIDTQTPGEHSGTFRGNNLAFVTARQALEFWNDKSFLNNLTHHINHLNKRLTHIADTHSDHKIIVKGLGLMKGLDVHHPDLARQIQNDLFHEGVILETCGGHNQIIKIMPPLTIDKTDLEYGLDVLERTIARHISQSVERNP
jgi:diaminobutyrate-2-oxoglutarate transaminase